MATVTEIAAALERLEAEGATTTAMLAELDAVRDPDTLWRIADQVPALLSIMRTVYQKAVEIGANESRARGYLSMAHFFSGDFETASALVSAVATESEDPVLLNVWALLPDDPRESLHRLRMAVEQCPDARNFRSLADLAIREGALGDARQAVEWLIRNAADSREEEALRANYKHLL